MEEQRQQEQVFKILVVIRWRKGIRDPQGETVAQVLSDLDKTKNTDTNQSDSNVSVSIGKAIDLTISASDEKTARTKVDEYCHKILANPISESWEIISIKSFND